MTAAGSPVPAGLSPLDRGRLRARLAAGQATIGTFVGAASPVTAEACAAAGVDWLVLDLEHGTGGEDQLRDVIPAAIDGVDVLFVGPQDRSHNLGVPGDLQAASYLAAVQRVRRAAQGQAKACGLLVGDGAAAAARLSQGWTFVAIASDTTQLRPAAARRR